MFPTDQEQIILKSYRTPNTPKCQKKKKKIEKKEQSWRYDPPRFQIMQHYYSNQNNHTNTHKNHSLEISPHTYGQLIYNKGGKTIQWRKHSLSSN